MPPPRLSSVLDPEVALLGGAYARALLELIPDDARAAAVAEELAALAQLPEQIEGIAGLLAPATRTRRERVAFVERVFAGRTDDLVTGLLFVMARNDRLFLLRPVAEEFRLGLQRRQGRVEVIITTAFELEDADAHRIADVLAGVLGAPPVLRRRVDERILGGLVVHVGDRVYDASLAGEIIRMHESLARRADDVAWKDTQEP